MDRCGPHVFGSIRAPRRKLVLCQPHQPGSLRSRRPVPAVSSPEAAPPAPGRLERLETYAQIRSLPVRYAAAISAFDSVALSELYVEDVRVGGGRVGREALREAYFGAALDRLSISVLHV